MKQTWQRAWEAEVAAWKKSPTGQATTALYAAAKKAGFANELGALGVEVSVQTWNGVTRAFCEWDREKQEDEEFVFGPAQEAVFARAEAWTKKYAAAKGWKEAW